MRRLLLKEGLREEESQQDFFDRVEGWRECALLVLRRHNATHPKKKLFLFWENTRTSGKEVTEISLFIEPAKISEAEEWVAIMEEFAEELLSCLDQVSVRVTA